VKAPVRGIRFEYLRLLPLPFHIGPAAANSLCESTLNLLQLPFHIGPTATNLLWQSTSNLLQLLPIHTGPASNNSLCESTLDVLSPLQLFDIAKLLYVVKAFVLRYPVRIPTARLLPLPFLIGPAATDTLCESALNLLQLPFHIGPAVTDLLCHSTLNLLQLLPFHTGPAANN